MHSSGRRLTHADVQPGHTYTVSETGHVKPFIKECKNPLETLAIVEKDEIEEAFQRKLTAASSSYLGVINASEMPVTLLCMCLCSSSE